MWKTPTRENLSSLISEDLNNAELAAYFGCGIKLIEAYLEEFNFTHRRKQVMQKPIFKSAPPVEEQEEIQYFKRKCLSCTKYFESEGAGNRICDPCKRHGRNGLDRFYEGTA